jgi:hypothetical protein
MQAEPSYIKRYLRKIPQAQIIRELKSDLKHLYALVVMNFYWRAIVIELERLHHFFGIHGEHVR